MERILIQLAGLLSAVVFLFEASTLHLHAQDNVPPSVSPQTPSTDGIRAAMVLRISDELLERLFTRDINRSMEVDRCVLGTRSYGTSETIGRANVSPKPDRDDAAFRVVVNGTTQSLTTGRNGPAIIHSRTQTKWSVAKTVLFDQGEFITHPGVIESHTEIQPLGVGSTKRGLRGRLVKRVASKRVCECRRTAARIVNERTKKQVLDQVNQSVGEKIRLLNYRIQAKPILDFVLSKLDSPVVALSTSHNSIHVAFLGNDVAAVCPLDRLEPEETELWIHLPLLNLPDLDPLNLPAIETDWVEKLLPGFDKSKLDLPMFDFGDLGALQSLNAQWVDDWVVLRPKKLIDKLPVAEDDAISGQSDP